MSPERLSEIKSAGSSVGIRGMRERPWQFKGEMQIESDTTGTRIMVTIPVPKSVAEEDESTSGSLQRLI